MVLEASDSPAPPLRRRSVDSAPNSSRRSKRSKLVSDEEYMARCLVSLSGSSGDASPTPTAAASQPPELVNSYKCGLCGKAFPSHQALGGHKASHRIKPPTDNNASAAAAEASNYACGPHPIGGRHQCSTCGRRFATGQALGGHMRKHYDGVIGCRKNYSGDACSVVTSSSESVGASYSGEFTPISPRNFDLNSPPPSSPDLNLTLKL